MEADWEFEVGGDAPAIEAHWAGYLDLRMKPGLVTQIPEVGELPALADVLVRLNGHASPVWTSKCGVWSTSDPDEFDADEMDAPPGGPAHTVGCYIDLLPKGEGQWAAPEAIAEDCKRWCAGFRLVALRCCRVDLIVRRAFFLQELRGLGITSFVAGCGESASEAKTALQNALAPFADVLCSRSTLQ